MATYGLKNLVYAVIESEDDTSTTYGDVKDLAPAMNVGIAPANNSASLRGDDEIQQVVTAKGPKTITLGTNDLPKEAEADLLGKTVDDNGLLVENADDKAPYVALGFKAADARGGYKYVWIYRIRFSDGETTYETKQETPAFQTPTITGTSLPRLDTKDWETKAWDGDESITDQTIFDEWFNEVIDKDWAPAV